MDEPVDTAAVAAHLKATRGLGSIDIPSAYHSTWLDNTRAKLTSTGARAPISPSSSNAAWTFQRTPDDPRKVWYAG
jgi:UDP-glucose 4-epimerase